MPNDFHFSICYLHLDYCRVLLHLGNMNEMEAPYRIFKTKHVAYKDI